jgi:hypothetical protein
MTKEDLQEFERRLKIAFPQMTKAQCHTAAVCILTIMILEQAGSEVTGDLL